MQPDNDRDRQHHHHHISHDLDPYTHIKEDKVVYASGPFLADGPAFSKPDDTASNVPCPQNVDHRVDSNPESIAADGEETEVETQNRYFCEERADDGKEGRDPGYLDTKGIRSLII